MADEEPVIAPDQLKPGYRRAGQIGAVITIVAIVLMAAFGNHEGRVEEILSYSIAALIAAVLIADVALRRSGLR